MQGPFWQFLRHEKRLIIDPGARPAYYKTGLYFSAMNAETHQSVIRARWRGAVTDAETGYTAVPDILIRSQKRLQLSATEMVVLLNILLHWWQPDEWPFPRISTISERMGIGRRTVERAIQSLREKGLLIRLRSESINGGPSVRRFDLSGLIHTLERLVEENERFKSKQDNQ